MLKELIRRDLPYIIVIILCLGAVIYDLMHQQSILDSCNEHWLKQLRAINQSPILYPGMTAPANPVPYNLSWKEK